MPVIDRLRRLLLRWDVFFTTSLFILPFAVMALLGFLWLIEHGWLLWFIGLSAAAGLLAWVVRRILSRSVGSDHQTAGTHGDISLQADPEWGAVETAAFEAACRRIETLTAEVLPWEALPDHAVEVINRIAVDLGGEHKTALHFTLPEALLLLEKTASRYREHLRSELPFADRLSVATLQWLWQQRSRATLLWRLAMGGRRAARLALNPTAGIMREIEELIAGGNSGYLAGQLLQTMQALLLEEVAYAAVELYSGRLRFSDGELLKIQLEATQADASRLWQPDQPVRILLVGQVSSGKSTLINALIEEDRTETDTAPTTAQLVAHPVFIDETLCHVIDTPGLDGSADNLQILLREMEHADLVLWTVRADRPAREPDAALLRRFEEWFGAHPERRCPPVIAAATCVDRLASHWPYPEHMLPAPVQEAFAAAVEAIIHDLPGFQPRPVCSVSPTWNVAGVASALEAHLGEALQVQRNRIRHEAGKRSRGMLKQVVKSRGFLRGTRLIGERIVKRNVKSS